MSASMHQRHRVEDEELQWQHWLSSISVSWANGLKGEEEILTSKQNFFTAKKLLRYASVGIIIDCLSQSSTILPHPATWCWWQCRCNACRAMQCLPRNAMHWLPKWPPTCRRKILGPRFDYFWAAKHVRTPLICRIKKNQNKIQAQKSCLILETRFIPNRPYRYSYEYR